MFQGIPSADAWRLFYDVACMCHPSQGGSDADMLGLCSLAREALDDWPENWTPTSFPSLFDIFCKVTGTPPPPQLDMASFRVDDDTNGDWPVGVDSAAAACRWAPAGRVGYVCRVGRIVDDD